MRSALIQNILKYTKKGYKYIQKKNNKEITNINLSFNINKIQMYWQYVENILHHVYTNTGKNI